MIDIETIEQARAKARQWRRAEPGHDDGWVLWLPGEAEVAGWTRRFPREDDWVPGTLAIGAHGEIMRATGGDDILGAVAWRRVDSDK